MVPSRVFSSLVPSDAGAIISEQASPKRLRPSALPVSERGRSLLLATAIATTSYLRQALSAAVRPRPA